MLRKSLSFSGPSRPGWHGQLVGASSGNWRFWSPARVCTVPCLGAYMAQPIGASLSHQWFPLSLPLSWNATKICPEVRIKKKNSVQKFHEICVISSADLKEMWTCCRSSPNDGSAVCSWATKSLCPHNSRNSTGYKSSDFGARLLCWSLRLSLLSYARLGQVT